VLNKDDFNKRFNNYIALLLHTLHIIIINIIISIIVFFCYFYQGANEECPMRSLSPHLVT